MTTYMPQIVDFLLAYDPPDPGWRPALLTMGGDVFADLTNATWTPGGGWNDPSHLLGLRVELTSDLPADVWRLRTDDGRVIHDSRSGRKLSS